jgi:N-acyl-D-amino-acid deacylase
MNRVNSTLHDLALRGGVLIDGTGAPRRLADILVTGACISAVVAPGEGRARETLDISGQVVCPGFIDSHSHDDQFVLMPDQPQPKLSQGVCTVVTGNCGISLAPLVSDTPPPPLDLLGEQSFQYPRFEDYLQRLDQARLAINVAPLIGHITLRVRYVADLAGSATLEETQAMKSAVRAAMQAGAFGLSTGVYYPPAKAANTAELTGVAEGLQGFPSVLACHLRDEGDHIDAAMREAFAVAKHCGATLVLSHHKVVGPQNHGRTRDTLRAVDIASQTQPVCLDCYPYDASSTMLEPEKAARTREVLLTWSKPHPELSGQSLSQIANGWGVDLIEAARRLMPGGAIYFSMAEQDVQRVLLHPLAMIGSDGLPHDSRPHPRLWGSFARVLGHYSRDLGLLPLELAIHKMTGLPAHRFCLGDRGVVRAGLAADLVVFDASRVREGATYSEPRIPAIGIQTVLVNGRLAVSNGIVLSGGSGRRLKRSI